MIIINYHLIKDLNHLNYFISKMVFLWYETINFLKNFIKFVNYLKYDYHLIINWFFFSSHNLNYYYLYIYFKIIYFHCFQQCYHPPLVFMKVVNTLKKNYLNYYYCNFFFYCFFVINFDLNICYYQCYYWVYYYFHFHY